MEAVPFQETVDLSEVQRMEEGLTRERLEKIGVAQARGRNLIRLDETLKRGGRRTSGFPALAVGWLSEGRVVATLSGERVSFQTEKLTRGFRLSVRSNVDVSIPFTTPPGSYDFPDLVTDIPVVPQKVLDSVPSAVPEEELAVLFEVEGWEAVDERTGGRTLVDPYLIQQLAGSVYQVMGVWEPTALEQAVV